jgi:LacI family transcriptional regulator
MAGVSVAAASFALAGRDGRGPSGSARTQEKVRRAAEELGYVPNRNARAMRTGRSGGIVLALGTLGDPWGVSLARAVRERALPHDMSTLILGDERWSAFLQGTSYDCSFVTGADFLPDGLQQLRAVSQGAPGIVAFTELFEPEQFDVIHSSALPAVAGAYDLLRARHDKVTYLTFRDVDTRNRPPGPSRSWAFLDAAERHGDRPADDLLWHTSGGREGVYRAALEVLRSPDRPEAVICSTGYQAIALQLAAEIVGLRVPDDLEIVSIGDVPSSAQILEPISYYGVQDVFGRIADVVIERALDRASSPGRLHRLDWEFFPGVTTR